VADQVTVPYFEPQHEISTFVKPKGFVPDGSAALAIQNLGLELFVAVVDDHIWVLHLTMPYHLSESLCIMGKEAIMNGYVEHRIEYPN